MGESLEVVNDDLILNTPAKKSVNKIIAGL